MQGDKSTGRLLADRERCGYNNWAKSQGEEETNVSADKTLPADLNPVNIDLHDSEQVKDYFACLERNYPQVLEAMRVMGISYQQYLTAMRSLSPHSSFSSNHTEISL